jgi:glucokinase
MRVLVGDVGGTKCLLALCDPRGRVFFEKRFESKAFPEFHLLAQAFLREVEERPDRACFAVAGPVVDDRCRATNLPWVIDARTLESQLGVPRVKLVNDFYAQALAVLELPPEDIVQLHPGTTVGGGPVAILGAGTGLGEAFLFHTGARYEVISSEGGHVDFAPTNERQIELLRWLREKVGGRVSYERVLSGNGLVHIYSFLRDRGHGRERPEVRAAMEQEDPAAVITRLGLPKPGNLQDELCDAAVDVFCEVYGQEAGNLALKILATGGVYLVGGVTKHVLPRLLDGPFQRAYVDKGRLSPVVKGIPVRVVTNPRSGLVGAAVAATRL